MKILPKFWQKALFGAVIATSVIAGCSTQQLEKNPATDVTHLRYQS